ncbi:MAG: hypothetical protein ACRDJE_26330 [Dehalococcoidia bacterium]
MSSARADRLGTVAFLPLLLVLCVVLACAPSEPEAPTGRRVWVGPSSAVASTGVITYDRREIAQKVALPACISVGDDQYRFTQITTFSGGGVTPPGLNDTFFRLDRWRLWTRPGPLEGQPLVFVTVRGSTGIVAEYERVAAGEPCDV